MSFSNTLLQELQNRGFIHSITKPDVLDNLLNREVVTVYAGFDCTADSLHVGNLLSLIILKHFQRRGHQVVAVIGTATTLIGDPSGKDKTRPVISVETVNENAKGIENNIRSILGDEVIVRKNGDWLFGIGWLEFLRDFGRNISVNRMLTLDSVKNRLDNDDGMTFLEFNYSLMQSFDFLHLTKEFGTVIQVGGSDQFGNIVSGIDMIHHNIGKESFGLTTPLLTDSNGNKMGKSVNGAIWLSEDKLSNFDFWQFWRNVDDKDVVRFLKLFAFVPLHDIDSLSNHDPNVLKKFLATQVTNLVRGAGKGNEAEELAKSIFESKTIDNLPVLSFDDNEDIISILLKSGVESKSAAKRLIDGNGVKINDDILKDISMKLTDGHSNTKLSVGKKNHFKMVKS